MEEVLEETNKIVEEIFNKFIDSLSKEEEIEDQFISKLYEMLKEDKKMTPQKLESILYQDCDEP